MKRNENEKITRQPDKNAGDMEAREQESAHELEVETAAAALWSSLTLGENPMLSSQQSMEAAGMLGNQAINNLVEKGTRTQDAMRSSGAKTDLAGLSEALSGSPDGPVCNIGTVIGGGA